MTRDPNIQSPSPTPRALNIQKQKPQPQESAPTTHTSQADQRQRRKTQQSKPLEPAPLSISGGATTSIAAALALEPGPIVELPAFDSNSARNIKEDRRGKGEGAGGLDTETVSAPPGTAPGTAQGTAAAIPLGARGTEAPVKSTPAVKSPLSDLKVVTFLEPTPSLEDRESVCQSPSWEAYGRRKKEKKERVQADREAKSKKRRLTKVPHSPATTPAPAPVPANTWSNLPVSTPPSEAAVPSQSASVQIQAQTSSCTPESRTRHAQTQSLPAAGRSASAMASYNTDFPLELPPVPHTPRGRSGSFSSLFKAPFEFRRPSIDNDKERQTGFIGGIKLEQHRNDAYQRALDETILGPGGEVHPAFRRERRSSSPLRIFRSRQSSREPDDRHYPPIAIKTSGNQGLLPREPSSTQDGGMMKKWRKAVGLKASPKGHDSDTETNDRKGRRPRRLSKSSPRDESATRPAPPTKSASMPILDLPPASRPQLGPSPLKSSEAISSGKRVSDRSAAYVDNHVSLDYTLPPISPLSPYSLAQELGTDDRDTPLDEPSPLASPLTSDDLSQPSFTTADEVPPPPPRKSSKRKSLISLNDMDLHSLGIDFPVTVIADSSDARRSSTSLSDARTTKPSTEKKAPSKLSKTHRQSLSNPPSIQYESLSPDSDGSPKRTLRDAARSAFGRPLSSASQYVVPNVMPSSRPASRSRPSYYPGDNDTRPSSSARDASSLSKPARVLGEVDWRTGYTSATSPPTNSSDDSATDDGHSPDTPDTSRPQSERGGSFDPGDGKRPRPAALNSGLPSPALSSTAEPSKSTDKPNTVELDNVQAAAMKVMAAFPEAPPRRPESGWRSSSESNLTVSFLPKTKRDSFQSSRDRSRPRPIQTNIPSAKDSESKSPPLRDLLMAKDESAATAPWPATYLEAARKAAPAAPPPKALNVPASSSAPNLAPPKRITPAGNRSRQSSPGPSNLSHQRNQSRGSTATGAGTLVVDGEPIAKMFVECCACKFYHDMPSKLYEAMAHPEDVVPVADNTAFAGALSMTVKCPWCKHEMSTKCCAGLAAMVYVKERLH